MMITRILFILLCATAAFAQNNSSIDSFIQKEYASLENLYKHLHSNPELSYQEEKTAARIAEELRKLGFEVTEQFGTYLEAGRKAYGIVAVMKNGEGPTVMVRTDLDGLPMEEKTGLPYASKAKAKNDEGLEVPVMHGCGHDMHMTVFIGTARALSSMKDQWKGTLIMIGQPAEEPFKTGTRFRPLAGGLSRRRNRSEPQ